MIQRDLLWINNKINTLSEFIQGPLFEEPEEVDVKNMSLVLGGYLRAFGAAMDGRNPDELDLMIEPSFHVLDTCIGVGTLPLLIYFLGSRLLSVGLNMNELGDVYAEFEELKDREMDIK